MELSGPPTGLPALMAGVPGVWHIEGEHLQLEHTAGRSASGPFKLLFALQGSAQLHNCGARQALEPGECIVLDGARPVQLQADGYSHVIALIPRPLALSQRHGLAREVMRPRRAQPQTALLGEFLLLMASAKPALQGPAAAKGLRALLELLPDTAVSQGFDAAEALRRRADAVIDLKLDEIDAAALAQALRVSRRHLDKAFERVGVTASQWIWQRRLQRAAQMLRAQPARAVTDVAFAVGFKDASHFSRAFAQAFGAAPSRWRQQPGAAA